MHRLPSLPARFIVIAYLVSLAGCISLKPVSELSDKSLKSLAIYEEMPISYQGFCDERCQFNLIRRNLIIRDTAINCDCSLFADADKATTKVYRTLAAYFKSLGAISEGDLTTIDTKSLNEALVEGKFGSLTIDKNTVTAYSSLGRLVIQAFTDGYRKQKIRQVIETGNPHIQTLIGLFRTSVGNLVMELNFQKERNFALYSELLMEKLTGYDKVKLSTDYYKEIDAILLKQQQLNTFSKSLTVIAGGHQKLFDNRNKLTVKEIRAVLGDYSAALQDLIADFKKL
ncbi:hypothetical protein [Flavitalea sp.]|nr:hypothetical protein [Flavitalea sp.]